METMLSLNIKFFCVKPYELINIINKLNKNGNIKGFEIMVDNCEAEQYLIDFLLKTKEIGFFIYDIGHENGKKNYVGGSTFLELYEAFMEGKEIYLWNEIPEGILFDEISGFSPKIINGNLDLVK